MKNLNLLFNKTYYTAVHESAAVFGEHVKRCNEQLFRAKFSHEKDFQKLPEQLAPHRFVLQVAYPGLLLGLGNSHSSGIAESEIAAGFFFDYTSGQPCISGSSVKGMLRSIFKDQPQITAELLEMDVSRIHVAEAALFEEENIFFDAVVYDGDDRGLLVGPESITPHPDPLQNPLPISLIKVLPKVRFEFRFRLKDTEHLSAQDTLDLFKTLLTVFGIGAKTNVGYGVLHDCDVSYKPKETPAKAVGPKNGVQWQGFFGSAGSRVNGGETTMKICPHCGRKNFKYRRAGNVTTDTVNWNWEKNICFGSDCRRSLE